MTKPMLNLALKMMTRAMAEPFTFGSSAAIEPFLVGNADLLLGASTAEASEYNLALSPRPASWRAEDIIHSPRALRRCCGPVSPPHLGPVPPEHYCLSPGLLLHGTQSELGAPSLSTHTTACPAARGPCCQGPLPLPSSEAPALGPLISESHIPPSDCVLFGPDPLGPLGLGLDTLVAPLISASPTLDARISSLVFWSQVPLPQTIMGVLSPPSIPAR